MSEKFSIVIPILNEEESLRELIDQINRSFKSFKKPFEIVFVDDGSTDTTFQKLQIVEKEYKNIKVYSFRRNLGKSHALMCGFFKASGDYVVTMDADLQDDPQNIKILYQKLTKGEYDMVSGWRKNRKDTPFKKISSKFFNNLVSFLFGIKINDLNSGLKLYRANTAKDLRIYGGMHRFIPVIAHEMGYRVAEKEILHHPRKYGKSKYKPTKILTDIPDLITIYFLTKYTRRPLHFFGKTGTFIFGVGFIILSYLTVLRFMGESIGTRPLLILGVLLVIMGIQTVFTGLLADLLVNLNTKDDHDFPLKYQSSK